MFFSDLKEEVRFFLFLTLSTSFFDSFYPKIYFLASFTKTNDMSTK